MGRDYVTLREEQIGGQKLAVETSVGRTLLASAPARVTRHDGRYRIVGAAWGGPIARVEVRIDDGPWLSAAIDRSEVRRVCLEDMGAGLERPLAWRARHHLAGCRHRGADFSRR